MSILLRSLLAWLLCASCGRSMCREAQQIAGSSADDSRLRQSEERRNQHMGSIVEDVPASASVRDRKKTFSQLLLAGGVHCPHYSGRNHRFEYEDPFTKLIRAKWTGESISSKFSCWTTIYMQADGEDAGYGRVGGRIPKSVGLDGGQPRGIAQSDSVESEYDEALRDAQLATARLKAAERRLTKARQTRPRGAGTKVSRTDAGTLIIKVPASGLNANSAMGGAFAVAWFSAVVPATASMLASGGASALFMLPFWLAGGAVAKESVFDPAKSTMLSIGEFAWDIKQRVAGRFTVSSAGGATEELDHAIVDVAAYINGIPTYVLRLVAGESVYSIGSGMSVKELEWISGEINAYLQELTLNADDSI